MKTHFVGHHPPGEVGHRLQLVVDEQLGGHHDEAKGQQEAIARPKDKAVPALKFQYLASS